MRKTKTATQKNVVADPAMDLASQLVRIWDADNASNGGGDQKIGNHKSRHHL